MEINDNPTLSDQEASVGIYQERGTMAESADEQQQHHQAPPSDPDDAETEKGSVRSRVLETHEDDSGPPGVVGSYIYQEVDEITPPMAPAQEVATVHLLYDEENQMEKIKALEGTSGPPGVLVTSSNEEVDAPLTLTMKVAADEGSDMIRSSRVSSVNPSSQVGDSIPRISQVSRPSAMTTIRPPPSSMIPAAASASSDEVGTIERANSIPMLEATLVKEPSVYDAVAVQNEEQPDLPWWKRHHRCLVFGLVVIIVLLMTIVGTLVGLLQRSNNEEVDGNAPTHEDTTNWPTTFASDTTNTTNRTKNSPSPSHAPSFHTTTPPSSSPFLMADPSCETFTAELDHTLLLEEEDCITGGSCATRVAISQKYAVVSQDYDRIQFFFNPSSQAKYYNATGMAVDLAEAEVGALDIFEDRIAVVGIPSENYTTGYVLCKLLSFPLVLLVFFLFILFIYNVLELDHFNRVAYVYERHGSGWIEAARLMPDDIKEGSRFGFSASIHGGRIVVGTYNGMSAYVYHRIGPEGSWVQEARLAPGNGTVANERFGGSVYIQKETVAVGDMLGSGVFVYQFNSTTKGWDPRAGAIANIDGAYCGASVAVTHDQGLLVGCPYHPRTENGADFSGAVLFFTWSESDGRYILRQTIRASDAIDYDYFGDTNQIALEGNILAIGMGRRPNSRVYVFTRNETNVWTEATMIDSPAGATSFGRQIYVGQFGSNKVAIASNSNAYVYSLKSCA